MKGGDFLMIKFTDSAANHIKKLQEATNSKDKYLRILIECGGCSGNQYRLGFDVEIEGDTKFIDNGVIAIVDKKTLPMIKGTEIDYVENLEGSRFIFNNPNAIDKCDCGKSFNL
jgi:iron-sulfur cluster assembly accessory protein